jgi:hypothetical protein
LSNTGLNTSCKEENYGNRWKGEEQRHFNAETPTIYYTANCPDTALKGIYGDPKEEDGKTVVETTEDEDTV